MQLEVAALPQGRRRRAIASAAGLPGRVERGERREVPRTHVLTDIAAVDVIGNGPPLVRRDVAVELDREVGDAPGGVQFAFAHERPGRTRVDALRAAAA